MNRYTYLLACIQFGCLIAMNPQLENEEKNENIEALCSAAEYGECKKVNELLKKGVPVNGQRKQDKKTALHCAAQASACCPVDCKKEIILLLYQYGARLRIKDSQAKTPVDIARSESARSYGIVAMHFAQPQDQKSLANLLESLSYQNYEELHILHTSKNSFFALLPLDLITMLVMFKTDGDFDPKFRKYFTMARQSYGSDLTLFTNTKFSKDSVHSSLAY